MNEQKEEVKKKELTVVRTLGEQGLVLPIANGNPNLEFSFKDWDMEVEEELSDLLAKAKNVGKFVRSMMDLLLDTYNGKDWDSYSDEEKVITLSQESFPNMMYMYIALRLEELGHELVFDALTCPSCGKVLNNFVADLGTLAVICKEAGEGNENLIEDYELKRPITLDGGKVISGLRIGVTKWGALESVPAEKAENGAVVKKALMNSSIEGALHNGEPVEGFVDLKTLIKKIKKIDIERIGKVITQNNGGPDMKVGGECPSCSAKFVKQLDWGYETFFDSSSL